MRHIGDVEKKESVLKDVLEIILMICALGLCYNVIAITKGFMVDGSFGVVACLGLLIIGVNNLFSAKSK